MSQNNLKMIVGDAVLEFLLLSKIFIILAVILNLLLSGAYTK